jgi:hypothetical protein
MECPDWPKCISDPQKEEYLRAARRQAIHEDLLRAAALLEEHHLLPASVAQIRLTAEEYASTEPGKPGGLNPRGPKNF